MLFPQGCAPSLHRRGVREEPAVVLLVHLGIRSGYCMSRAVGKVHLVLTLHKNKAVFPPSPGCLQRKS